MLYFNNPNDQFKINYKGFLVAKTFQPNFQKFAHLRFDFSCYQDNG